MNRGGRPAAAADSQGVAKNMLTVRNWVSLDCTGRSTVLDVDKHVIMRRAQIHARDLRIIDPMLSYPSAILGRERAIVLNLEVYSVPVCGSFLSVYLGRCVVLMLYFVCGRSAYQSDHHCRRGAINIDDPFLV